ncbi:MAG: DUF6754 domain-containing protein [Candidatus Limnocylindria bacterium]
MPNPAELFGDLIRVVGDVLGASSLRLGIGPTLAVLGVLLVLLQLVARPVSRWVTRDPGGLAGVGRGMALAAEAGTGAVLSLGNAGIARSTNATSRLMTLAGMPVLRHVARAAARSGVPLSISVNDPLAAIVARWTVDAAHRGTATTERSGRSRVAFDGEGRPAAAGLALSAGARPAAAFAAGSLGEEATVQLRGLGREAGSTSFGTPEPSQAVTVLLAASGALIGPELFQAPAELRAGAIERTTAIAGNRLMSFALVLVMIASALVLSGVADPRGFLMGVD